MKRVVDLKKIADELWPLNRSITGIGVRETHDILSNVYPLKRHELPTGTQCLDWEIPKEWNVKQAHIISPSGQKIFDFAENNLRLVGYSVPFNGILSLSDLLPHLHSMPEMPDAIPYKTSYYKPDWGFCVTEKEKNSLEKGNYKVVVDTELFNGSLTISDCIIPGESDKEILIHCYTCHPSLGVNELSGPLVTIEILKRVSQMKNRRFTYRFIFAPETIGTIAYLDLFGDHLIAKLYAGYVCTCVGHLGKFTYKKSRISNSLADRALLNAFNNNNIGELDVYPFSPSGSDERQYCSQGFNLPVGSLMRTPYHQYPEYHTSKDNLDLMQVKALYQTADAYLQVFQVIEDNAVYCSRVIHGEPFFTKHGELYSKKDHRFADEFTKAVKWIIHFCDGHNDLINISDMSGIKTSILRQAANRLEEVNLVEKISD